MTSQASPPPLPSEVVPPKRRAPDQPSGTPPADPVADPERLYAEWQAGKRTIESLAAELPLSVVFSWHTQRRISEAEFGLLVAGVDVHQVDIGDVPHPKAGDSDAEQRRLSTVATAFKSRLETFEMVANQDTVTESDLRPVLLASTPLADGIGMRMTFVKCEEGQAPRSGTPPLLTVLCRAYIASASTQATVKCEALFSGTGLANDLYCRVTVALPIHRGGRRRLLFSVLDNETRQPVKLPPELGELFHEKNMLDLQLLRKPPSAPAGLGSAVKGALGRIFRK